MLDDALESALLDRMVDAVLPYLGPVLARSGFTPEEQRTICTEHAADTLRELRELGLLTLDVRDAARWLAASRRARLRREQGDE